MELFDLKIFIAVAEEGKTTKAAKLLNMTQPGVSQHIAKLEIEIGGTLFDRRAKRLYLNDFGRIFLGKARKLLEDAKNLKEMVNPTLQPIGSLRLGLTDSSTLTVIPPALAKFRSNYPMVKVRLDVDDSYGIEKGVLRGHYDLGVINEGRRSHPDLDKKILYRDRIDVLVSKQHPLAKKSKIPIKELANWPLLLYPRQSRTRRIIDDVLQANNIFPKEIIDVFYNTVAVRLAEVGMGIALLSEAFISEEIPKHRCKHLRIIGDPFKRSICLIRKRDAQLSDAVNSFYEILMKHI